MQLIPTAQVATLRDWFTPERPGPLIGPHVISTGHGTCHGDRWPDPRTVLAAAADNYSLAGDPAAIEPAEIADHVTGFVEAPEPFVTLVYAAFPAAAVWDRVVFEQRAAPRSVPSTAGLVRPLRLADADHLAGLSSEVAWIVKTWGGPAGLASSGRAHGAFIGGRLVSVACPFFVGRQYEDIGVATERQFRGHGLSTACAAALCADIQARGRHPSWTTSVDNIASRRVAEKLGFTFHREDHLLVCGISIPVP